MELETLKQANEINDELIKSKAWLKKISYTQSTNVEERVSHFNFNGTDREIPVPKNLFRVIGKLIESEYVQKIKYLEDKLKEL